MKIIHLASFNGNVGDMINHIGFYNNIRKYVTSDITIKQIEIRNYYRSWNEAAFDQNFIDMVNDGDLFVVGGGDFFRIEWDYSLTGTTFNMQNELFDKINIPIVFNAVGVDIIDGNEKNIVKFRTFLENCARKQRCIISVRNDGSYDILKGICTNELMKKILKVPDGGFFTSANYYEHIEIPENKKMIALNITKDRNDEVWGTDAEKTYVDFVEELANYISLLLTSNKEYYIVFVPHILSDIEAIYDVLRKIKGVLITTRVSIAPLLNGDITTAEYITDIYRKAYFSICMRYHANISSIAMGTPTIAPIGIDKHIALYKDIGLKNRVVDIRTGKICERLMEKTDELINDYDGFLNENKRVICEMEKECKKYFEQINKLVQDTQNMI